MDKLNRNIFNDRCLLLLISLSEFNFIIYSYYKNKLLPDLISNEILFLSFTWVFISYVFGRYHIKFERGLSDFFKYSILTTINIYLINFIFYFFNYGNFEFENFHQNFINRYLFLYLTSFLFIFKNMFVKKHFLLINDSDYEFSKKDLFINNSSIFLEFIELDQLEEKLNNQKINSIIINNETLINKKLLFKIYNKKIELLKIETFFEKYLKRIFIKSLSDAEIFDFERKNINKIFLRNKKIVEFCICIVLLIFLSPILLLVSYSIKLQDGGRIIYKQKRNGFNSNIFSIYKFRSMIENAEFNNKSVWSKKNDKRITKIGKYIRKFRLDELPQLINILFGEMSLIGPRPERPDIDENLSSEIKCYYLRYKVKPGISGWAQVNYPYGASINDAKIKLSYDLFYIKNCNIFLDLIIFFKTIKQVINGKGAIAKS